MIYYDWILNLLKNLTSNEAGIFPNVSKDIKIALQNKKMSTESNRNFITAVVSAILAFKKYPTASDYENVEWAIVLKYLNIYLK